VAKMLTMMGVQKMRAGSERITVKDAGCKGLSLIIQPSGHKSWQMRFRQPDGKLLRLTLGAVDVSGAEQDSEPEIGKPLTLAAARRLAADVNRKRAQGHDFKAAKERQVFERDARSAKTFLAAALDFIERHSMRKVRRWRLQARSLGIRPRQDGAGLEPIPNGLADRWAARPLADIDGDDVHALIRECRERGIPGIGRRNMGPSDPRARGMYADLSKFFAWCIEERRLKINPCAGVTKPRPPRARDRVLTDQEIVLFWKSCGQVPEPFGDCLKILLLTACRRAEVSGMRRSEFNGSDWTIPKERSKNHRAHLVPLSPLALEILAGVPSSGDLVFSTNNRTPINGWSGRKAGFDECMLELAGAPVPPWTIHDIRRTAATKMASIGVQPHVVEAVLGHVSGFRGGVAGVYNLYAYFPEKKAALERWAAHVAALVAGTPFNVVPLRSR
jgi:integrase